MDGATVAAMLKVLRADQGAYVYEQRSDVECVFPSYGTHVLAAEREQRSGGKDDGRREGGPLSEDKSWWLGTATRSKDRPGSGTSKGGTAATSTAEEGVGGRGRVSIQSIAGVDIRPGLYRRLAIGSRAMTSGPNPPVVGSSADSN